VVVGYVDDVQFVTYDSDRKEMIPREQWMMESEGRAGWERKKMLAQEQEMIFKADIPILMSRTNQSGGESSLSHHSELQVGMKRNPEWIRNWEPEPDWLRL